MAARGLLADLMTAKLQKQGISPDEFPMEEFVEHCFSGADQDFNWDTDHPNAQNVVLDSDDMEALFGEIEKLMDRSKSAYQEAMEETAKALVRQSVKDWPERESWNSAELHGFKKRLLLHWSTPLKLFYILLQFAEDIFFDYEEALLRSRAKSGIVLREVLLSIQARTLRTSRAVAVLLENGLADDAYARWRTLYELNVFGTLIAENGDDAASRYRDHEFVDLKKAMDNALDWGEKIPKKTQREVVRDYDAALKLYGDDFRHPECLGLSIRRGQEQEP